MMQDKELWQVLEDEFGAYDTMVFCELFCRYHELAHPDIDSAFTSQIYQEKAIKLRNKILNYGKAKRRSKEI